MLPDTFSPKIEFGQDGQLVSVSRDGKDGDNLKYLMPLPRPTVRVTILSKTRWRTSENSDYFIHVNSKITREATTTQLYDVI